MLVNKNIKIIGKMRFKLLDKIAIWLYERILTYPLWKWLRAHKYSDEI